MKATVWQRLDLTLRNLTPFLLTLVLLLGTMVPFRLPELAYVAPSLSVMAAYYWALHRPDLFPAWAVFLIGILEDALRDGPLGVNVVVLLLVYAMTTTQRRFFYNKSFLIVWWGFAVVGAGAAVLTWILVCLALNAIVAPGPSLFAFLMTVATYPLAAWLFAQVQRTLPARD